MRTTLRIDDDVLRAARALAAEHGVSIGAVISELARRGMKPAEPAYRKGFPVFEVRANAPAFGPGEVQEALEEAP